MNLNFNQVFLFIEKLSISNVFILGGIIRLLLILYGDWQDNHLLVKYTDIDYNVFTDASRFVSLGESPYERATYRYTPLLAYLLLPNIWWSTLWGKLVFILCDLLVGYLLYCLLSRFNQSNNNHNHNNNNQNHNESFLSFVIFGWILNPIVINVSTRGNSESLVCLFVVLVLYTLYQPHLLFLSAFFFGIVVHLKVYPVIYTLAFLIFLTKRHSPQFLNPTNPHPLWRQSLLLINRQTFLFGTISASVFLLLGTWMYHLYGYEFLDQTYFYHLYRADHRHNMSLYFYHLYLSSAASGINHSFIGLVMFLPQLLLMLVISFYYSDHRSLPVGLFLLTLSFVTFNKVCTVQYFVWYLVLLPLVAFQLGWSRHRWWKLFRDWLVSQLLWLFFAYLLEFQGMNSYFSLFLSSIVFFMCNIQIMYQIIKT